ncbi:LysR family transcriptional regulator [Mesorhizobium sp. M2D.F.Ca.ET.185.01.1.1]|uniref:LysR substrate-binding domain-containing protein n=1 Tax=unclassified Mesorhizobium TaxID=325217 RepID=UPI000FCAF109|nr:MULTISPECIES: LysR substrate-binding domain-containing protein [unclassified Mesorhizobium]TGP53626.1 LysR family transcriptional regulator [bacterium M00.F.Ca.ET.230.01.1.1]TGP83523.1 LysR family transcriptional regulator [bacterium M00.F.Ca.ET.227.01.1.1]TGP99478.1 LysR family transcriptional regulator [bacterium M00.F.Ca.ET.221.01.1.1]TGQ00207.1 LysR family transcriptional regulator [bacterium M00.F.Ca.ET.222.01.1.1]TGU11594.1 LysR family transcriptional regulator [bacterium M00.F.Ca.ET.
MDYLPLNAIRAFEATARHLSFSAAGEELHVTHPAISHQIRRLEEWLGVALFHRDARKVRLTEAGLALQASAGAALAELDAACRRIRRSAGLQSLSVGCIPSIASRWLVPRLSDFTARHPEIAIRVAYAKADDRLEDDDNDVLITLGADPSPKAASLKLFSRISRPACSPHYLARKGRLDTPARIAAADLLHDETRQGWQEWFAKAGTGRTDIGHGPVFADFNILATAVIAGHGVALCPIEVFREELRRGDLVVVSDISTDDDKGYFLTMSAQPSAAEIKFADWFCDQVSADI